MKRKIKYSNLLILGIIIYIIFQIVTLFIGIFTKTIVLKNEKIELKVNKKGLVIREETLIKADSSGYLNMNIEEGEKIKKGQIAQINSDKKVEKINEELKLLNKDIEKLENDLKKSNNKLNNEVKLKNLETKKNQQALLNKQKNNLTKIIYAPKSCNISYKYDDNEDLYNINYLESIKEEDIEYAKNNYKDIERNKKNVKEGDVLARFINSQFVYIAVNLSKEESKNFKINEEVKLSINKKALIHM